MNLGSAGTKGLDLVNTRINSGIYGSGQVEGWAGVRWSALRGHGDCKIDGVLRSKMKVVLTIASSPLLNRKFVILRESNL